VTSYEDPTESEAQCLHSLDSAGDKPFRKLLETASPEVLLFDYIPFLDSIPYNQVGSNSIQCPVSLCNALCSRLLISRVAILTLLCMAV
jgi:hypothetical protein